MPKKTTKTTKQNNSPTQGEIARLINDTAEMLTSSIMQNLVEASDSLNLTRDQLTKINDFCTKELETVKERSVNQLLKYY